MRKALKYFETAGELARRLRLDVEELRRILPGD